MWTWAGTVINSSLSDRDALTNLQWIEGVITWIIIFLVFLRIISIIRTAKDINTRTNNTLIQIISILLVTLLTPILWRPLYLAMRPIQYKKDKIPRREACATNLVVCYNCKTLNPKEYNCCISCGEHLKTKCKECESTYPHDYRYCNSCGAPNIEINEE